MKTALFALCSVVWMFLIFYLSSIPGDELGPDILIINLLKKTGHFIIFGVLAVLYFTTFQGRKTLVDTGSILFLLSLFLTVLYAVSDEYHQSFTPGRHSSGYDVIIDACGAVTVLGLLYTLKIRRNTVTARASKMAKGASRKTPKIADAV
jgi:VanZ family protein